MTLTFVEKYIDAIPHKLWHDDYQPKTLQNFVGNEIIVDTIHSYLKGDTLPNMIFYGPPGSGKTTLVKLLVQEYLGKYEKSCHMQVIGSIHRGKNVVSEKNDKKKTNDKCQEYPNIINFIKKTTNLPSNKCKIVTIYDFDAMTNEAQMALRRIIEIYSFKVRFIFICSDINNVIEAIQSRTIPFKLTSICTDIIKSVLQFLAKIHAIDIQDQIYDTISIISNGDLKQAINYLQVFSQAPSKTLFDFYHVFNMPSLQTIQQLINFCLNSETQQAFDIIDQLITDGYNVCDILDVIIKVLCYNNKFIPNKHIAHFLEATTMIICRNEISSSTIHLYKLIVSYIQIVQN